MGAGEGGGGGYRVAARCNRCPLDRKEGWIACVNRGPCSAFSDTEYNIVLYSRLVVWRLVLLLR